MIIWDDAQQICKDFSNDPSAASLVFFKRHMNIGYKQILSDFGRPQTEQTITATTVASQRAYQMPSNFIMPKSVVITIGSQSYPLLEEESQEMFDFRTQNTQTGTPEVYFVRQRFGVWGTELLLDPVPAGAYTLTIIYESSDRDLTQDKYTTGTVTLTENSATVTGAGTSFSAAMVGRYLASTDSTGAGDGLWYRIQTRSSTTSLALENVYEGVTLSTNYQICESFNLPEDMHILPCYYALQHYFAMKRDDKQEKKYYDLFSVDMEKARRRHSSKSRGSIIRPKSGIVGNNSYPSNFPSSGISS